METLLDKVLPTRWPDDLAIELTKAWRKAVRGEASAPMIRSRAVTLEARMRELFGDPEPPRRRLRAIARRLIDARTGKPSRQAIAELEAAAEKALTPHVNRATRVATDATEELLGEVALAAEAQQLHRLATSEFPYADTARDIIDHEACALGTALHIYWQYQPHYYRRYRSRRELAKYERPKWDLLREIERRLIDPDIPFPHLGIAYDPRTFQRYDWTVDDPEDTAPPVTELPPQVWQRTTTAGAEPIAPPRPRRRSSK